MLETVADLIVLDALVGGEDIGQAAAIGAALHIVLAAQGVEAGAFAAILPVIRARLVRPSALSVPCVLWPDAHAPVEGGSFGGGIEARRLPDIIGRHAAQLLRPFRRAIFKRFDVILKILRAPRDEFGVKQAFLDDDMAIAW